MLNKNKVQQQVVRLLKVVAESPDTEFDPKKDLVTFHRGESGVALTGDGAKAYRECLATIVAEVATKKHPWSPRALEERLQEAILGAPIDSPDDVRRARRFSEVARAYVDGLSEPPTRWHVHVPVLGIGLFSRSKSFGKVRFQHVSVQGLGRRLTAFQRKSLEKHSELGKRFALATTSVTAHDREAARTIGRDVVWRTLHVMNFYGDIFNDLHQPWRATLAEAPNGRRDFLIVVNAKERNITFRQARTLDFHIPARSSPRARKLGYWKVSGLLRKPSLNDVEERLLTSMSWAGQAAAAPLRHEGFLKLAVALEALLSRSGPSPDATDTIAYRCAHLLRGGESVAERVRELYRVRSQVVHRGKTDITDADLSRLRQLVKRAIFTALLKPRFRRNRTEDDLERFFEKLLLAGS